MENEVCPLCGRFAQHFADVTDLKFTVQCNHCGVFQVNFYFAQQLPKLLSDSDKAQLSGYVREMNSLSKNEVLITTENYNDILNSSLIPHSIKEKLDKLILYIYRNTAALGDGIGLSAKRDFSVCYAQTPNEYNQLIMVLYNRGYVDNISDHVALTYQGMEYAESIAKKSSPSNSVFVAMWFSPEMASVYETAIKPAIEAKECGSYKAFRVDNHEHNNDITDEIIAGIKECRFLVADMTGYRGGVYYEAGFAKGLGKPVIFTCRKDWFDGELSPENKPIKERIHFDINHQNIIVWEDPEDLKQRIINRIRATII